MLRVVVSAITVVIATAALFLSPWNIYRMEGWVHCAECHSISFDSCWAIGIPPHRFVWNQKPAHRFNPPARSQDVFFNVNHTHDWSLDDYWFRRLGFMSPSSFVTAPDFRNGFASKFNQDPLFADWVELQVAEGRCDPEDIRNIFRERYIELEEEPLDVENPNIHMARQLLQSYSAEQNANENAPGS